MIRPKGLGRGLDALLAGSDDAAPSKEALRTLAIDRLMPGRYQPRTRMDDASLAELADSIREQGVMQPILVRPVEGGRFEIIAGERRWRAAQKAGLREVPALVKSVPDQAALALALIENIQREDLNPIEEAQGLKRLVEEFGITHEAAAKAVGRSRSAVTNLLRLTQLPKPVQDYVLDGAIDMGHARALLALPAAQQTGVATRVVNGGLSVRETERLVHGLLNPAKRAARRRAHARDADTIRLENEIAEALGAKVAIEAKQGGKGRLVIAYSSLEQLDGIVTKLKGS
ncbi:MAG: ParB/RepB/Spo0J family partition protein [Betaproteobacteria bacterium]